MYCVENEEFKLVIKTKDWRDRMSCNTFDLHAAGLLLSGAFMPRET